MLVTRLVLLNETMKRILPILLSAIAALVSCEEPEPVYVETDPIILDQLKETSVGMITETDFVLNSIFTGNGYTLNLAVCNKGLALATGVYTLKDEISSVGDCTVILNDGKNDLAFTSGSVVVKDSENGLLLEFKLAGKSSLSFIYDGPLDFSFDVQPSPNTFFVMEGDVTTMNDQWQTIIIGGVTKYSLFVVNPEGKDIARIELIGKPGLSLSELTGTYSVRSSVSEGTAIAGSYSWWGGGSGSYFTDGSGSEQYIMNGKITFSSVKGSDGIEYFSMTGSGLSVTNAGGIKGTGDLSHRFVKEKPLLGRVERNHVIDSKYKNREMKYSVYLPDSYDGVKEFPVLWLIHGYGDDQNSWLDKGFLYRFAHEYASEGGREMIIVTPDGLTDFYMGAYENYFFKELMPEVESRFKVKKGREYRTVAGLSMGGHGSLYYGLKYNDMFCYAYAMSPACMFDVKSVIAGKDKADLPGITIETGIQDQTTNLQSVENIHKTLLDEGVFHEYITRDGGHDWTFWQEALPKVLRKSGEVFGE